VCALIGFFEDVLALRMRDQPAHQLTEKASNQPWRGQTFNPGPAHAERTSCISTGDHRGDAIPDHTQAAP